MKRIQLWSVKEDATGPVAEAVTAHENVAAERHLEEILVRSPELLGKGMTIVARQAPTEGGPLDLLGVDESGRLVLFELKRGVLRRDAVAQALDYISDLVAGGVERIAELVEQSSGRLGVERIDDFQEWYEDRFPGSEGVLASQPKVSLVGLGVDSQALRIVDYFHAFDSEGTTFLARQVESVPQARTGNFIQYKARNLKGLLETARSLGCQEFFEEVIEFFGAIVTGPQHPAKHVYTFNLVYSALDGKRNKLACVSVQPDRSVPGNLRIAVLGPAVKAAPRSVKDFRARYASVTSSTSRTGRLEVELSRPEWKRVSGDLARLLQDIKSALADGLCDPATATQKDFGDEG